MNNKLTDFFKNFEKNVIAILLPVMCVVIFVATFLRYTNIITITWAEEVARYLMIWLVFIGIGGAAQTGSHFAVTIIVESLPKKLQAVFKTLQALIVTAFSGAIIYYSIKIMMAQIQMAQTTPTLNIPMWTVYAAIPIGSFLMLVRYLIYNLMAAKSDLKDA